MEKKVINVNNSIWSKKVIRSITIGQLVSIAACILSTLIITILLAIYTNLVWTLIIFVFLMFWIVLLNVKSCFLLKIAFSSLKWLFSKKSIKTKILNFQKGVIKTNKKQFLFFEITCNQKIGNQIEIERQIWDVISKISQFQNWSIINTQLPFDNLKQNLAWVENKRNEYLKNRNKNWENDSVLKNIVTNEFLLKNFISGNFAKNTYLFCLELDLDQRVDVVIKDINYLNKELEYQNFELSVIKDEAIYKINENLFLSNKKIQNKVNYILATDENNNKQYYHFIKINNLPNFVNEGYLDFLNNIDVRNSIVNFSINTYSFKNFKKESKIWENQIKNVEYELDKVIKHREKLQAEHNLNAIEEINEDIVQNNDITQKYEVIIQIIANNRKDLFKAIYRTKEIIRKANKLNIEISHFNQLNFFYSFQRNILDCNNFKKRIMNILPNNLIALSYPFMNGNNLLNNGWYIGQLFNGNPALLNLNEGQKQNNSSLIIGKTGSGKSTFINFLIKNNMSASNVKTILFDPKGEYILNSEIQNMNPKIISLNNENDMCLNPFELCKNDAKDEKINFMLQFFKIWFDNEWDDYLKNSIINALNLCLEDKKWNFSNFLQKIRTKIDEEFKNKKLILDIFKKLSINGVFNYFSKTTKLDLNNNLIIFNLNEILIDLSQINKVKLMLIFKYLKSYIYNQNNLLTTNKKIQIIVDEFPAIARADAPFIVNEFVSLIRLIRSYDTSIILTMQDVVRLTSKDNQSNESLKSVANNVEHKFIMNMNSEQLNIMKSIWGDSVELSEDEEFNITTKFHHGDMLYTNKANRYYLNATDPNSKYSYFDKNAINQYFEYFLNNTKKTEK